MDELVDDYALTLDRWRPEFEALRPQLNATELVEEFKWRKPCYTCDGSNIVIFQPFKAMCALLFVAGRLLDDPEGLLREQGRHTQRSLRLEFRSMDDVRAVEPHLAGFVQQAIANERAGLTIPRKDTSEYDMPEELLMRFEEDPHFFEAFDALTPGRQRGYLLHFGDARKPETRIARIDRCTPRILDGLGMHD
jgi:uncharacterized protein YdeI (YjbR/CyaY-like superfamily)